MIEIFLYEFYETWVPARLCQEFLGTIDLGPSKLNSSLGILGIFQCTKPIWNVASGPEILWEAFF